MDSILKDIVFNIEEIERLDSGIKYRIKIKIPMIIGWISHVNLITKSSEKNIVTGLNYQWKDDTFAYFENEVFLPTQAIYHYYFTFKANQNYICYTKNNTNNPTINDMWQMSVNFKTPDWSKGKIMYHIFIDRFNKDKNTSLEVMNNRKIHKSWDEDIDISQDNQGRWNTDFYGGNLKGIIDKLDYIKSLGVSIIYISPICESQSNHRYDTADYKKIDPYVGNWNELRELCTKAHKKGIKIILDAVFNHTGNDSKYFNEYNTYPNKGAYQGEDSKYFPFYRKNNDSFDYWWGMKNLPVCDGDSKEWQNYIYGVGGVIDLWFSYGIDGLRLDVADELTDEFIEGIRMAVKRNKPDGFILGEVWENPMRMNRTYISSGKAMDSVMNYQLVNALIRYYKYADCDGLKETVEALLNEYPKETLLSLMNFTSTHDITRIINIFATDEFQIDGKWAWDLNIDDYNFQKNYVLTENQYQKGRDIYLSYMYTLAFFPGILSIFYGDEIGMQGMGNLANRRPYPWTKQDTYLLEQFQKIGKIRNQEKFLETADLKIIDINQNYFAFERTNNFNQMLIYASRTNNPVSIVPPDNYTVIDCLKNSNQNHLDSYGGLVMKRNK